MSVYGTAKNLKKTHFKPWQRYVYDVQFLYQGVLLLFSAIVAALLYAGTLFALLKWGGALFTTEIRNGDIFSTVVPPVFWTAVACALLLLVLIVFARPLSTLLLRLLHTGEGKKGKDEKSAKRELGGSSAFYVHTVISTVNTFYVTVLLIGLFPSVVFSTVYKNGIISFPLIFACLTFLTYFAKKLLSYPVFLMMNKTLERERKRRMTAFLSVVRPEGTEFADPLACELDEAKHSAIFAVIDRVLVSRKVRRGRVCVVMGEAVSVSLPVPARADIEIGVTALSILTEEEFEAFLSYQLEQKLDLSMLSVRRFRLFCDSIAFSVSSWNPLERIYFPISIYFVDESRNTALLQRKTMENVYKRILRRKDPSFEKHFCSAALKFMIHANLPFADSGDFYISFLKETAPALDYHTRMVERFFSYTENKKEEILDRFCALSEMSDSDFSYRILSVLERVDRDVIDVCKRPSGEYGRQAQELSSHFDAVFAACVGLHYEEERERRYTRPLVRIKAFERERINGKETSTDEILRVAAEYLSLSLFSQAESLLRELSPAERESHPYAKLLLGEIMMRTGRGEGATLLFSAAKERPAYAVKALDVIRRCYMRCFDLDRSEKVKLELSGLLKACVDGEVDLSLLYRSDDVKGEYLSDTAMTVPMDLSKSEIDAVREKVEHICADRLEWAAFVSVCVDREKKPQNILVVRCADFAPGSYTGAFFGGVYSAERDPLKDEIRYLGDLNEPPFVSRLVYDVPVEVFERIEGAIICRRGAMVADKILSAEARSFYSELDDGAEDIEVEQTDDDEEK